MNNIRRKSVLITGGSRSIGKAIALKFGSNGYNVCITYNSNEKKAREVVSTLKKMNCDAYMIKVDLTRLVEIERLFLNFDQYFKSLDVLVNNAGWTKYIPYKEIDDLSEEIFDKVVAVNLKAVFYCTKFARKRMIEKDCSLINISSIAGYNGIGSNIAYCAAKAGIINMTKSLAQALAPNIRVNSVAPGLTKTDMTKSAPKSYKLEQTDLTPLKRIALPEDIADVVFSLSEYMKFVNGKTIIVDGGRLV